MYKSIVFVKFSMSDRIEHWIFAINVALLALTGFVQISLSSHFSIWIIREFNGIENIRLIHHILGFLFFLGILLHIGIANYDAFIRKIPLRIFPDISDIKLIWQGLMHNLSLTKKKPELGRTALARKVIYWTLTWGSLIMIASGFIILNPIAVSNIVPGVAIPTAKVAHLYQAILAVLAIGVWHGYYLMMKNLGKEIVAVHPEIKNVSGFTHPLEVVDAYDGYKPLPVDRKAMDFFWRNNLPRYLLICGALIWVAMYFVNFEHTSLTTVVPAEMVKIYSPSGTFMAKAPDFTTALPTTLPQISLAVSSLHSWKSYIGTDVIAKCVGCHDNVRGVSLRDYRAVMQSKLVVPGNSTQSPFISALNDQNHNQQFSPKLLEAFEDWIQAGAPEVNIPPLMEEYFTTLTWVKDVKPILTSRCVRCHGKDAVHGLDFRSYYSTLDSGSVKLSSPDESEMLIRIQAGGHPGQFTGEELLTVNQWIWNGAPYGPDITQAVQECREITNGSGSTQVAVVQQASWTSGISSLFSSCTGCHDSKKMGGLDLTNYEALSSSGVITPGNPDASKLVSKMKSGSHAVSLSAGDLKKVIDWIKGGAPKVGADSSAAPEPAPVTPPEVVTPPAEVAPTPAPTPPLAVAPQPAPAPKPAPAPAPAAPKVEPKASKNMKAVWDESVGAMFASCTGCHGAGKMAGLDLRTYDTAMASGKIIAGNPDGSPIVIKMKGGKHPALLSAENLAAIIQWIKIGH